MNLKRMIRASAVAALLVDEHGVDRSSQPHDKYDAGPDAGPDAGSDAGSDAEPQPQGPAGRHQQVPSHHPSREQGLRQVQRHQRDQLGRRTGDGWRCACITSTGTLVHEPPAPGLIASPGAQDLSAPRRAACAGGCRGVSDRPGDQAGGARPAGRTHSIATIPGRRLPAATRSLLFIGMGSSHYAGSVAAARLRSHGIDAVAELSSSDLLPPPRPETVVVAVSASGDSRETVQAASAVRRSLPRRVAHQRLRARLWRQRSVRRTDAGR